MTRRRGETKVAENPDKFLFEVGHLVRLLFKVQYVLRHVQKGSFFHDLVELFVETFGYGIVIAVICSLECGSDLSAHVENEDELLFHVYPSGGDLGAASLKNCGLE